MNRPVGFDATYGAPATRRIPSPPSDGQRGRQRRRRIAKVRSLAYAKVAGGALLTICFLAWTTFWMSF